MMTLDVAIGPYGSSAVFKGKLQVEDSGTGTGDEKFGIKPEKEKTNKIMKFKCAQLQSPS